MSGSVELIAWAVLMALTLWLVIDEWRKRPRRDAEIACAARVLELGSTGTLVVEVEEGKRLSPRQAEAIRGALLANIPGLTEDRLVLLEGMKARVVHHVGDGA